MKGIDDSAGGELHAMMLDMKRTFDEIVEAHADPERAAAILGNPFYQSLSAGFAGTQEYMAMEKLGQLRSRDEWDLIVVDTPPSRSALDFLDAPKRLGSFLDGKLIRVLLAPAKVGGRAGMKFLNVGMSMMTGALGKVLGGQLLRDVQTFVAAMDSMFGGFRTRADATYKLLQAPGTAFLVVAAPERDALREAAYFVERLAAEDMPLAGLVLNRVHGSEAGRLSAERALAAAENLEDSRIVDQRDGKAGLRNSPDTYGSSESSARNVTDGGSPATEDDTDAAPEDDPTTADAAAGDGDTDAERSVERLTAGLLRLHAERMQLLARERRTRDRFGAPSRGGDDRGGRPARRRPRPRGPARHRRTAGRRAHGVVGHALRAPLGAPLPAVTTRARAHPERLRAARDGFRALRFPRAPRTGRRPGVRPTRRRAPQASPRATHHRGRPSSTRARPSSPGRPYARRGTTAGDRAPQASPPAPITAIAPGPLTGPTRSSQLTAA